MTRILLHSLLICSLIVWVHSHFGRHDSSEEQPSSWQRDDRMYFPTDAKIAKPIVFPKGESEPQRSTGPQANRVRGRERRTRKRRICDIKYAEYIERIFPDEQDTAADAGEIDYDGRTLATAGEYPHMTALGFPTDDPAKFEYKCGGSLISDLFVITAAHCTNFSGQAPSKVRIGDLNLLVEELNLKPQVVTIKRIHQHPQYSSKSYYNDIGLLELSKQAQFTEFVRPIRLWVEHDILYDIAHAMGYGATSFAKAPTNRLTDMNMTLVSNGQCNEVLPDLPEAVNGIIDSQICARDFLLNTDTCQGDSGGPLQLNIRGRRRRERIHYHLIGITSFGLFCRSGYPSVYTRISSFIDWIEDVVWANENVVAL